MFPESIGNLMHIILPEMKNLQKTFIQIICMVQLKWKDRMKPAELKHIYGVAQGLLPRLLGHSRGTLLVFKQAVTRKGQTALSGFLDRDPQNQLRLVTLV